MLFNKSTKYDFPPELKFSDGTNLEVVSQFKLVGVVISDDLKWQNNTNFITQKAMQRIWILRRLKKMGMTSSFIIDVYIKEVRSILEQAVPVWNSGLTKSQINQIERVQKTALFVIFDKNYVNYENACQLAGLDDLGTRREELCLNFVKKDLKRDNSLFEKIDKTCDLRHRKKKVKEYVCQTARFEKSSLSYLAKLLNEN